jgi:hypothetical protein
MLTKQEEFMLGQVIPRMSMWRRLRWSEQARWRMIRWIMVGSCE